MKRIFAILLVFLLSNAVCAERILFYEVGSGKYSIQDSYSEFANELRKTYEVASIEKGEITKAKIENYDVIIVQDLNKQLTTNEISSLIWFVLQRGKGILINGGGTQANQLTIPFGTTIDTGTLIDTTNMVPGSKSRNEFVISDFGDPKELITIKRGLTKIGFYDGSGLMLSGASKCIARGDTDTYSDTGSFPAGSKPCVTSSALFGGGLVAVISDADMLSNKYIDEYNNRKLGTNIVEWLTLSTKPVSIENNTQALHLTIKEIRLENLKLNQDLEREKGEKESAIAQIQDLTGRLSNTEAELTELQEGMIGPFNRMTWGLIVLGVCLLIASVIYSSKKKDEDTLKDEDILDELGYELDSPAGETKEKSEGDEFSDDDLNI